VKAHPFAALEKTDNFKEIICAWITERAEHTHKALGRNVCGLDADAPSLVNGELGGAADEECFEQRLLSIRRGDLVGPGGNFLPHIRRAQHETAFMVDEMIGNPDGTRAAQEFTESSWNS